MSESEKPSRPPLVLVANDQEWSARSLESILGPNGYAVLRAYTGRQTIDLARSARPDVIILDLRLPDIDGLDVCRTLREDARLPVHTPIIVTNSGPSDRAQVLAAYKAGAWEYCSQPYDGELLLLKLESFVRAKLELDRVRAFINRRSIQYESQLDNVTLGQILPFVKCMSGVLTGVLLHCLK